MKRRLPHPLRRFRLPAVLLVLVILYGIAGYTVIERWNLLDAFYICLLYTSPSPRDLSTSRMPSSA